jgi:hypothetical protein
MNRVHDLSNLIQLYQDKIQPKQHHVILATHVATLSRDFVLNQDEQLKMDQYSGGNIQLVYNQNENKLVVKHIFINKTYVIDFQVSDFNKILIFLRLNFS